MGEGKNDFPMSYHLMEVKMKKKISLTNLAKEELSKGEKSLITGGSCGCECECECGCIGGFARNFNLNFIMYSVYDLGHEFNPAW